MAEKSITASILWDRFGLSVSAICAIHCLFFPVLVAVLPLASTIPFLHGWLHPLFVLLIAPTVYYASKRSHFEKKVTLLLGAGFLFVLIGWVAGHYVFGLLFETSLTVAGSLLLIWGHWLNYRHHQTCNVSSHRHHPIVNDSESKDRAI